MNNKTQKETTVQNEQQLKLKHKLTDSIIDIFVKNNLSINEARDILESVLIKLGEQRISITSGWIDANSYIK